MAANPFNQNLNVDSSSIPNSQLGQAGRDLLQKQVVNNFQSIVNTFTPPLEVIKTAAVNAYGWFRNLLPEAKHDYSNVVQFDAKHSRIMEQIAKERLELEKIDLKHRADTAQKVIQLQKEELQLQKERLNWEKSVVEKNFKLIKESQAKAIEEKRKELQMQSDMHYLPLQVSRDDIVELLSQESGKFVIIPSPPKIVSEMQLFKSLDSEVRHQLQEVIKKYYLSESIENFITCKKILKDSISEAQASVIGKFIAPIPTLIFHTEVTYQKIFISTTVTCPLIVKVDQETGEKHYKLESKVIDLPPWNWVDLKKELELEGYDTEASNQKLLELIATIHAVVANCFSDLYCLNLNPHHIPKLFSFLEEHEFTEVLQIWAEPFKVSLQETQNKIQKELDQVRQKLNVNQKRKTYSKPDDFEYTPVIAFGIVMMFMFATYTQQQVNENTVVDIGRKTQIGNKKGKSGVIKINRSGYNATKLRRTPNGQEIGNLSNDTHVTLLQVSKNGKWQRVTTQNGTSGWVWAEFVK
jgi:Bacterial SH3 domain